MDYTYRIDKAFKHPWFNKPYIEYQLVRIHSYWKYDPISCWGDAVVIEKVIFTSKDQNEVLAFHLELTEDTV